jgi:nucleotide-binding universal stress UspA family protein
MYDTTSTGPIVCGVNDSTGGREAVVVASALSERLGQRMLAVHVESSLPALRYDGLRKDAIRRAEKLLAEVAASGGRDGGAAHRAELGRPAQRLAAVAFAEHAEMIVVGSRGRGPLAAALLGSTAREVIALAPCPVLVVPPGATTLARTRPAPSRGRQASVLCGVDGSPESGYAAEAASQLAWRMNDRLVLAHSYTPATTYGDRSFRRHYATGPLLSQWRRGLRHLDGAAALLPDLPEPEMSLEPGDPGSELRRVAKRERAEILVVGSHGQGKIEAALYGSVAASLAASAPIPVLVVPPGTRLPRPDGDRDEPTVAA